MRIERPLPLDLRAVADGVIKNNMGLGGLQVRVRGTLADGRVTFVETGQQVAVSGGPARSSQPWLWFDAKDFGLDHGNELVWLRETPLPVAAP